ncbi:MAG TPA: class F sortase, partial [Acidimicrobiales bacterium]
MTASAPRRRPAARAALTVAAALAILGTVLGGSAMAMMRMAAGSGPAPLPQAASAEAWSANRLALLGPASPPSSPPAVGGPAAATAPAAPRLMIPSLHVTASLDPERIDGHQLSIPGDVRRVGWWTGGATLDARLGTVLVAGHVNDLRQGRGALWNLAHVDPGAPVFTVDRHGHTRAWRVASVVAVAKAALPQSIFTPTGPARL